MDRDHNRVLGHHGIVALLRARVGLSSRALADELGISQAAIGRLERGRSLPNFPVAARIAGTLSRHPVITTGSLEPWNAVLFHDLVRHVLGDLKGKGYKPLWIMRGHTLPGPSLTGRATVQLVEYPTRQWLLRIDALGWPQSLS